MAARHLRRTAARAHGKHVIRPEARDTLWRWREVMGALALAGLGLWWGLTTFGVLRWLGWGLISLGLALAFTALRRLRFAGDGNGPGVVLLDERRVVYMGPDRGGAVDLDQLLHVVLTPDRAWRLTGADGVPLDIPLNAKGAETLFDAFAALPGLDTGRMLVQMDQTHHTAVTIWTAPDRRARHLLH